MSLRLPVLLVAVLGLVAWTAPPASAGTYSVFSCRTPAGALAPTDGWSGVPLHSSFTEDNCAAGGGLSVRTGGFNVRVGWYDAWQYSAPSDTTFERLTFWRSAAVRHIPDEDDSHFWATWIGVADPGYAARFEACGLGCSERGSATDPVAEANKVVSPQLIGVREAFAAAGCGGRTNGICEVDDTPSGQVLNGDARLTVHAAQADIRDDLPPAVGDASGPLADEGVQSGVRALAFDATDQGGGLYHTLVQTQAPGAAAWDTQVKQLVDRNEGRCAELDHRADTDREFGFRVPCLLEAAETVEFDTTTLPDGVYRLRVLVEDAAGNTAPALPERRFEIENVPPPAATTPPAISGSTSVGSTLSATPGVWTGAALAYAWQWSRCTSAAADTCTPLPGATAATYTLTEDDQKRFLRVTVTATNREGATTADSAPVGPVPEVPQGVTGPSGGLPAATPPPPSSGGGGGPTVLPASDVNGVNASRGARLTTTGPTKRRMRFRRTGRTRITLRDENGRPITGASIVVLQRMAVPGAAFVAAHPSIRTDDDGRVNYLIAPGFSRTLRFAYAPTLGGPPVVVRDLAIVVPSRTTLRTNRSFLRNGETLRFAGKLRTGPVPAAGVAIDLQARVGRRWQTFRSLATRSDGTWRSSYRFRATTGLQTYAFRARVRRDSGFPYAPSRSKTVKVRVRG